MLVSIPFSREEVLLDVRDVHLRYGDRQVLRGVSATVRNIVRPGMEQGQVIGLLGPSGIGKTQLFRILAGLQEPSTGQVLATGKQVPVRCGQMGLVSQNCLLYEHRTVLGNLLAARHRIGISRKEARERALALLERFGLGDKAYDYPAEISGGQRQRVAIAQQLLGGAQFLLMDEPFSGLDPVAAESLCHLLSEISQMDELATIIVSSHDLPAVCAVADTLWALGRDRDEHGERVPGARVQASYDLIDRGLAWRPGITSTKDFSDFVAELRGKFHEL